MDNKKETVHAIPKAGKVLIYRWKAYTYEDIIDGFHRLRYETEEMEQHFKNYDVDEAFEERLRARIRQGGIAFVFSVNYFALIAEACHELGIRYVSWACDNPLISLYHRSAFYDTNRIFSFDLSFVNEFRQRGVKEIYYLPLGANVNRIDAARARMDDSAPADPIVFIGRLYHRNNYDRIRPKLPTYLQGYFDAAIAAQSDLYGANVLGSVLNGEILTELGKYFRLERSSEGSFSSLGLIFETTTLGFKIAEVQRMSALRDLSKNQPVVLYTTEEREDLPGVENRGLLDYWSASPSVMAKAGINLNFTIPNIRTGIPLRVWDVLGAGGFLLTNFQPEFVNFFQNGKELVWFHSHEELLELADYYRKHPEERERIARAGREAAETGNTVVDRMREMLEKI